MLYHTNQSNFMTYHMVVGVLVVLCCYFSQSHVSYSFRRVVSRESHTKAKDPPLRERAHAAIWDLGKARGIIWRYDIQLSAQRRPHHNNNTTTAEGRIARMLTPSGGF